MPLLPVSLDWVLGFTLELTERIGLATGGVETEIGAEVEAEDMEVMDIELFMIL